VDDRPVVPADDVGAFLVEHRPPRHRYLAIRVPPHAETGASRHEVVLSTALNKMITMWPGGTKLTVDYPGDRYTRALAYPPDLLTENGQLNQPSSRTPSNSAGSTRTPSPAATGTSSPNRLGQQPPAKPERVNEFTIRCAAAKVPGSSAGRWVEDRA
jgi:hypothetical protein